MIQIFDILSAIGTIICLNMICKSYKWWLYYLVFTTMFILVMFTNGLVGQTCLGIALFVTGLRNYLIGRKNG